MEKIKIENLSFSYPNSDSPSLSDINLNIDSGEFIVICGKSGSGKSTLLKSLKPIISPHGKYSGEIYLDGRNIQELTQRVQAEKIGFVMQNPDNQIVCDKVWHELVFGLESLGLPKAEIRTRAAETASFFGIQGLFYKNVHELSGGQKQLLNLAAVMIMNPEIIILDEPTSQLDPIAAHDFLEAVHRINRELGTTVILSEHRLEEAVPLSDRTAVMDSGKIIAFETAQEIGSILNVMEHDMLEAMPTPMKIFYKSGGNGHSPITIREGKAWLEQKDISDFKFNLKSDKTVHLDSEVVLEMKDIYFRYEKNLPDVLKGLSLKLHLGELYAIVGGNGTGKSTALSVAAGINLPYRGKLNIIDGKRISALPQNPRSLFCKKTVLEDLEYTVGEPDLSDEEKSARLKNVISFCELEKLLKSHPYDLSGGEQQRAALAQVLLQKPDILLLDEPTKGLDAHFKQSLAALVKKLNKSGTSVIMVSHDMEFCAKYADKCGMFFDGSIISEGSPHEFFDGKNFYTTAANRMSKTTLNGAVLDSEILAALGVKTSDKNDDENLPSNISKPNIAVLAETKVEMKKHKLTIKKLVFGLIFAAAFIALQFLPHGEYGTVGNYVFQFLSIFLLAAAGINLLPQKELGIKSIQTPKKDRRLSSRTAVSAFIILLIIPLTIFFGIYFLGDRKYYFISLLIILEIMLPFAIAFEGRKPKAREVVLVSVLCALTVAGRLAFSPFPQFKPVLALIIISAVCLGGETGFLVGAVTGFVSNMFFGQGPWTPWQMFTMGIVGFTAGVLFKKGFLRKTKASLCIFGFLAALVIYGGIMNPASVLMYQPNPTLKMLLASYLPGLPVDLVHAVSTAFFLWFAAEPMCEKLERVKVKYGF